MERQHRFESLAEVFGYNKLPPPQASQDQAKYDEKLSVKDGATIAPKTSTKRGMGTLSFQLRKKFKTKDEVEILKVHNSAFY